MTKLKHRIVNILASLCIINIAVEQLLVTVRYHAWLSIISIPIMFLFFWVAIHHFKIGIGMKEMSHVKMLTSWILVFTFIVAILTFVTELLYLIWTAFNQLDTENVFTETSGIFVILVVISFGSILYSLVDSFAIHTKPNKH